MILSFLSMETRPDQARRVQISWVVEFEFNIDF